MVAPINKIPPEILASVPGFWDTNEGDENVIALTHVCRVWREVFVSQPSLWTDFRCLDADKTRAYLERSKSSPINVSLYRPYGMSPNDPFFQVIPYCISQLGSLFLNGTTDNLPYITAHLSLPAPLLENLSISGNGAHALTPTLFNGDLSSLRRLHLRSVRTKLPWRNMINLTTFQLAHISSGEISIRQLLDFFESAPRLREAELCFAILSSDTKNGRLVSLKSLETMCILDCGPPSALLDHLLIPIGARLTMRSNSPHFRIRDILPKSLDNLKNFPDFTTIRLFIEDSEFPGMDFRGPNGLVSAATAHPEIVDGTHFVLESFTHFDVSKTKRFGISYGEFLSRDPLYRALLSMNDLRAVLVDECTSPDIFIEALDPSRSSSEGVVCPKLEKLYLVLRTDEGPFDLKVVIGMAAARASRGKILNTVRIVDERDEPNLEDVLELRKHVQYVEYGPCDKAFYNEWP